MYVGGSFVTEFTKQVLSAHLTNDSYFQIANSSILASLTLLYLNFYNIIRNSSIVIRF